MDPNLLNLRLQLFDMRAMVGNGSTDNERARRCLNRALEQMADDIPTAFQPDEEHVVLYPDATTTSTSAYLQPTSDTRVLEFRGAASALLDPSTSPWVPTTDGTWDGVMHLEITDDAGNEYRRQSREWWVVVTQGSPDTYNYYVSLDRPIARATGTGWTFRVHQPEFWLRADVKQVFGPPKVYDDSRRAVGSILWQDARGWAFEDYQGQYNARPELMWRTRFLELPTPTESPLVTAFGAGSGGGAWAGPYQEGTFDFVYTFCWGQRDAEWQSSMTGIRDPQWESAPSPSASYSHTTGTGNVQIKITPALIDPDFGWYNPGGLRHGRGGFFVRVYGRRTAVDSGGLGALNNVETSNRYYLLAQFDPLDPSGAVYYAWDGSVPLDHSRPLYHSTGYYGYSPYPHQDQRYEIDIRCSRAGKQLIDDYDTVPMRDGKAVEALLHLACYHLSLLDGVDIPSAERYRQNYKMFVNEVRGQLTPVASIQPRGYGETRPRRRWRFTDS